MTARKGLFHGTGGIPFRGELAGQETAETKFNLIFLKSTNWRVTQTGEVARASTGLKGAALGL